MRNTIEWKREAEEACSKAENEDSRSKYTFQYVISFLVPLVGFILGALLLAKDDEEEKDIGKTCIIIALISVVISFVVLFVNISSQSIGY